MMRVHGKINMYLKAQHLTISLHEALPLTYRNIHRVQRVFRALEICTFKQYSVKKKQAKYIKKRTKNIDHDYGKRNKRH